VRLNGDKYSPDCIIEDVSYLIFNNVNSKDPVVKVTGMYQRRVFKIGLKTTSICIAAFSVVTLYLAQNSRRNSFLRLKKTLDSPLTLSGY